MSPFKTTALAVLIVAVGLIASIRLGNAGVHGGPTPSAAAGLLLLVAP